MRQRLVAAALLSIAGCGWLDTPPPNAVTTCGTIGFAPAKTDILFVVDDSGSMAEEQRILADNFQTFIAKLASLPIANDFQIGITTTSVDFEQDDASGTPVVSTVFSPPGSYPNSGQPYPAGALVAVDPATGEYITTAPRILRGDSPTLVQDFQNNVKVGTWGSGKEQGLRAARLAVSDRIADGKNAGFLRPGARLAVVILSDEDDCSDPNHAVSWIHSPPDPSYDACHSQTAKDAIEPVGDFVTFFGQPIAGERRNVVVGVIAGVNPTTLEPALCGNAFDVATRYKAFVDGFAVDGLIDSICNPSFASTLERIATLIGQEVPLSEEPADWRLLQVSLQKSGGAVVPCRVAPVGDATADVVYAPHTSTKAPTLTFQSSACTVQAGDEISIQILCAG